MPKMPEFKRTTSLAFCHDPQWVSMLIQQFVECNAEGDPKCTPENMRDDARDAIRDRASEMQADITTAWDIYVTMLQWEARGKPRQ